MFTCVLWRQVASAAVLVPNLSESADRVGGDKECPFSGVTKSGRVWRKVPESDVGSVGTLLTHSWPNKASREFLSPRYNDSFV